MQLASPIQGHRRQVRPRRYSAARRGAATVELALCLPIMLTTAFGMVETCNAVFLQARLQSGTFEAARYATRPTTSEATSATTAQVLAYCQTLMTQLNVNGATITLSPSSVTGLAPQTMVTVTVTAPLSQNTATWFVIAKTLTLSASATMIVE